MKTAREWHLGIKDFLAIPGSRQRPHLRRPNWVIVFLCLVSIFVMGVYKYRPRNSAACYTFFSGTCSKYDQVATVPSRELTDEEIASQVVIREILTSSPVKSKNSKLAFMFLTPGPLPFETLWDKFFQGHDDKFTIYVHASREQPRHVSPFFVGRNIRSEKVTWGKISMVDAERRLLANALEDPNNQQFVLLSDSCVPLHIFDYVYNYLIFTNVSFLDCFDDPGPHGGGRYSEHMLPEVEYKDFRKGSQWFTLKRQHAILVVADSLYYRKFRLYCRPGMDGSHCYSDEHYLPTLFHMVDPGGIANWSVTYVDWSEGKWHPKSYWAHDVTNELLKNITALDYSLHLTSDKKVQTFSVFLCLHSWSHASHKNPTQRSAFQVTIIGVQKTKMINGCVWNGMRRPCYLFARKFYPQALDKLMQFFSNYTVS